MYNIHDHLNSIFINTLDFIYINLGTLNTFQKLKLATNLTLEEINHSITNKHMEAFINFESNIVVR